MSIWLCPYQNVCAFVSKPYCGHRHEKPFIVSYHTPILTLSECYIGHMICCWDEWNKIKQKWLKSIKRTLRSVTGIQLTDEEISEMFSLILLHHDIGKLTLEYQNKEFFRHEICSSYILYHLITPRTRIDNEMTKSQEIDLLSAIFTAAVYLHHEGLQISHEHREMREPVYSFLLNWLSSKTFHMIEGWDEITNLINECYLSSPISIPRNFSEIEGSIIAKTLGTIMTTIDGSTDPLAVRMAVAAVLHPLTICDNLAANKRGGSPSLISKVLKEILDKGAMAVIEE